MGKEPAPPAAREALRGAHERKRRGAAHGTREEEEGLTERVCEAWASSLSAC